MTHISEAARAMLALDEKLEEAEIKVMDKMVAHMASLEDLRAAVIERDTYMVLMRRIVETAQEETK